MKYKINIAAMLIGLSFPSFGGTFNLDECKDTIINHHIITGGQFKLSKANFRFYDIEPCAEDNFKYLCVLPPVAKGSELTILGDHELCSAIAEKEHYYGTLIVKGEDEIVTDMPGNVLVNINCNNKLGYAVAVTGRSFTSYSSCPATIVKSLDRKYRQVLDKTVENDQCHGIRSVFKLNETIYIEHSRCKCNTDLCDRAFYAIVK